MIKNNEIDNIALPILKQVLKEAQSEWLDLDSKYREYRNLQIDKRGSFGERFFSQTLSQIYFRRLKIEYNDGDQGDWDLKFNNVKFEIKTSSIDVNKKFQNEGLKKDGDYDGVLFLGITPNELYIKFIKKDEINFEKLHNRGERGTGRGYKWDLKKDEMIKVSKLEDIKNEFEKSFNFLLK
ncbi:hypothetical protein H3C61_00655 [Candidatus Gracilibacteria bacterium]|nr:hypothetical protein [Candidatus Gracilibacteria bacterium]